MIKRFLTISALIFLTFATFGCGGGGGGGGSNGGGKNVTVNFDSGIDAVTVKAGTLIELPVPEPNEEGEVFGGWLDDDGDIYAGYYRVKENTSFQAEWLGEQDPILYATITGLGSEGIILTVAEGAYIDLPQDLAKDHYVFGGWHDGSSIISLPYQLLSSTVFTPHFNPVRYTVTFDSDGGDIIPDISVDYSEIITLPEPVKLGYTFVEWMLGGTGVPLNYAVTGNVTLVAKWIAGEPTEYNVIFKKGDIILKSETHTPGTLISLPVTLDNNGEQVEAKGWQRVSDGMKYSGLYIVNENTVFEALDTGDICIVSIDLNGGDFEKPFTTMFLALCNAYTDLPGAVRAHYTFTGWHDGSGIAASPYKITGSAHLTARWEPVIYTVTFKLGDEIIRTYDGHGTLPDISNYAPPKPGYTFIYWNTQDDGKADVIEQGAPLTKNMTVYGIYCKNITSMSEITDLAGNYILTEPVNNTAIMGVGTSDTPFTGIFYGGEFNNISILKNPSSHRGAGLFVSTKNAVIANVTINNGTITTENASTCTGGIVGNAADGTKIYNSHFKGHITANSLSNIGGIVGCLQNSNTVISECSSSGIIDGSLNGYIGGISGTISGGVYETVIEKSYSVMNVSGMQYVGGFSGSISGNFIKVSDCYAAGNVTSNGGIAGGFTAVLNAAVLERSYASGTVDTGQYSAGQAGGLVGTASSSSIHNIAVIRNSAALNPRVYDSKAKTTVGRVVGEYFNQFTFENVKALSTMALSTNAHLDGDDITGAEALSQDTYEALGWDFENVWHMQSGKYPKLMIQIQ